MQKGGNPHSFLNWSHRVLFGEAGFLGGVVRKFECSIKKFSQINFFADGLLGGRRLTRLEEILAADLDRRETYNLRDAVHVPLHREQTLWRSKAPKRPVWRSVRRHGLPANADVRPVIGTTGVDDATGENYGRQCRVCAAIDREINFPSQNLALFTDCSRSEE